MSTPTTSTEAAPQIQGALGTGSPPSVAPARSTTGAGTSLGTFNVNADFFSVESPPNRYLGKIRSGPDVEGALNFTRAQACAHAIAGRCYHGCRQR